MRALRALHRQIWGDATYDATYPADAPRSHTKERTRVAGFGAIGLGVLFILFGLAPSAANATQPNPDHKVTLCHATDSYSNPYVDITVDVASVLHHGDGHDGHNGPVFFPAIAKHTKWGDIIPPFDFGPGETYGGKNWTSTGIVIFDDGCALPSSPSTTTTTEPSTTTSSAPAPTTTSTILAGVSTTTTPPVTTGEPTTTTTPRAGGPTTTSSPAVTTSTVATVTTAGGIATTLPTAPTTTISATAVVLGSSTTITASTTDTSLPFTGGNSGAAIIAGLVLVAAGLGLTRRAPRHH